jgi:hypothetical protein
MPVWLGIVVGILAGMASLVVIFSVLLNVLDKHLDNKLTIGLRDVAVLREAIDNGVKQEQIAQREMMTTAVQGIGELKGRMDVFLELWTQERPRA